MDNDTKLINLALDAGEIMLKNGAETFSPPQAEKKSKQPPSPPPSSSPSRVRKRAPFP